jgi:hypothetical protein
MRCRLVDFECEIKVAEDQSMSEERRSLDIRLKEFEDEDLGPPLDSDIAAQSQGHLSCSTKDRWWSQNTTSARFKGSLF